MSKFDGALVQVNLYAFLLTSGTLFNVWRRTRAEKLSPVASFAE